MSFIILMGTNYQFGYNIGVLNQPADVSATSESLNLVVDISG